MNCLHHSIISPFNLALAAIYKNLLCQGEIICYIDYNGDSRIIITNFMTFINDGVIIFKGDKVYPYHTVFEFGCFISMNRMMGNNLTDSCHCALEIYDDPIKKLPQFDFSAINDAIECVSDVIDSLIEEVMGGNFDYDDTLKQIIQCNVNIQHTQEIMNEVKKENDIMREYLNS